jgi:hypothetical protein
MLFMASFKRDSLSDFPAADILLLRSDSDCILQNSIPYSSHTVLFKQELLMRGYKVEVVSKPFGIYKGIKATDNARDITASFAKSLILKKLHLSKDSVWTKLIKKSGAKWIIAIMPPQELNEACHALGIWIADIQHGVIAPSHPAYGSKFINNTPSDKLPKNYLMWDQESATVIDEWKKEKKVQTYIIGNMVLIDYVLRKGSALKSVQTKEMILVSLQWGLEKHVTNSDMYYKNLISKNLLKTILNFPDYSWVIRLHPVQLKEEEKIYSSLSLVLPEKIINRSRQNQEKILAEVLQETLLHITFLSSVTIEAAQFGIPTLLLGRQEGKECIPKDYFQKERKNGIAKIIDDDKEVIARAVKHHMNNKHLENSISIDTNLFYKFLDRQFPQLDANSTTYSTKGK